MAAKKGTKKTAPKAEKPKVTFPTLPLEIALEVPVAIKEKNGGNPWAVEDLAAALSMSHKTNKFYYTTAASRDFGLTIGTRNTPKVELTDLGRAIVYAPDPAAELEKKTEAFLGVDIFRRVFDHYKGSDLPEMKYLGNTLEREFGLLPEQHEEFSKLFRANSEYLGIKAGDAPGSPPQRAAETKTTVVVGEPKTASNLVAFVIMPFVEREATHASGFFTEVLRSLITPAAVEAGFQVRTANRQGSDLIQSTIIKELLEADLVICDLTEHNPNVLFELGIRMMTNRPVSIIKATGTGRVFDVDNMLRVFEYKAHLWRTTIETDLPELTRHIQATWDLRDKEQSYIKILGGGA